MGLNIKWGKVDVNAKNNSSPTMSDKQSFSNPTLLKQDIENIETVDYATVGELNQTILDNSQQVMVDSPSPNNIVLWSKSLSDSGGYFENNPKLVIEFSDVVTSSGITLYFWEHNNEYCREVLLKWYDVSNVLLSSKRFYPDSWEYVCSNYVEQYRKVDIEFVRTTLPKRFTKMSGIDYGEKVKLTNKNIVSANLLEEVGLTSSQLFTNQLTCDIIILTNNFNIITNPDMYRGLQINQSLEVASDSENYGTYYIQKAVINGNIIDVTANDLIGYLEGCEFKGGLYENVTFEFILNQIKAQANLSVLFDNQHSGFEVPTTIMNKVLSGYIPYTNCREALHQLCYAANVLANCKRGEKIVIFELPTTSQDIIDNSKLIMDSLTVEDNEFYSKVSLNAFSYKLVNEIKELENKEYEAGEHIVKFTSPHKDYTITGGTILESGWNYVKFSVTTTGNVVIKGYSYDEVIQQFESINDSYTGNVPVVKELTDVKMVSPLNAQSVADAQLSLYKFKYKMSAGVWNINANIGDKIIIENGIGNIQQMNTDILAEDICDVEVMAIANSNN